MFRKHRENTGNFVCSSCKFKRERILPYLQQNSQIYLEAGCVCQFSFVYVTNHVN